MSILLSGDGTNLRKKGAHYEALAAGYLKSLGWEFLEHSYRRRTGEVDLIMKDGETYVFVEVKYRSSGAYGMPAESVSFRKKQHIIRTSETWLLEHGLSGVPVRFDIAEVVGSRIRILRNAFGARSVL